MIPFGVAAKRNAVTGHVQEDADMMNFNNKKTKKIVTGIIIAFLVVSMVLPMFLGYLS